MPRDFRVARTEFKLMRGFSRVPGEFFSLSFGSIPSRHKPGAAVVISKKAIAEAHDRNRVRRRARAILSKLLSGDEAPRVFVFLAKKSALEASFEALRRDIERLMARARTPR